MVSTVGGHGPPKLVSWGGKLSVGKGFCWSGQNFPTDEKKRKIVQTFLFDANSKKKVLLKAERFWPKLVGWAQILSVGPNVSTCKKKITRQNKKNETFFFFKGLSTSHLGLPLGSLKPGRARATFFVHLFQSDPPVPEIAVYWFMGPGDLENFRKDVVSALQQKTSPPKTFRSRASPLPAAAPRVYPSQPQQAVTPH